MVSYEGISTKPSAKKYFYPKLNIITNNSSCCCCRVVVVASIFFVILLTLDLNCYLLVYEIKKI
jgi:hypothetical protein